MLQTGIIYVCDCLDALPGLPDGQIDLVYLDPPFNTGKRQEARGEDGESRSYEDAFGGLPHYVEFMRRRLVELHRVLRPGGSLYLHCDDHASHYLKVALDGIFGREGFRNEIVWRRTSAHNDARFYGRVHDTILFYTRRGGEPYFERRFRAYSEEHVRKTFRGHDTRGRYACSSLTAPGARPDRRYGQPWHGHDPAKMGKGRHWMYAPETLDEMLAAGLIGFREGGKGQPYMKRYLDDARGVPVGDVWDDIPPVRGGKENAGYPTQKPEALLDRVVTASCPPDGMVLDPFCGSGTTLVAAETTGRQWVGMDRSPDAALVACRRLGLDPAECLRTAAPLPTPTINVGGAQ